MYSSFFRFFIIILVIITFLNILFQASFAGLLLNDSANLNELEILDTSGAEFFWPLPNNHRITSYFGKRNAPTKGASSYHSGIDIAASEGTKLYSCISGYVTFLEFSGAGRIYYYSRI